MMETDVGEQVLLRYFNQCNDTEKLRRLVTIALFACRSDSLQEWIKDHPETSIDRSLASDILEKANVEEISDLLFYFGRYVDRDRFESLLHSAMDSFPQLDMIRDLVSAIGIYNRYNADQVMVSSDFIRQLLGSEEPDHRITALKAMRHSDIDRVQRVRIVLDSLRSKVSTERLSAMNRLLELSETDVLDDENVVESRVSLASIANSDDIHCQEFASRLLEMLKDGDEKKR